MIRKALAAIGVVLAVGGFLMLLDRGLAAQLTTTQTVLIPIGVLAGIQAYRVIRGRMRTKVEVAETPDRETEQDLEVPGESFDERVAELGSTGSFAAGGVPGRPAQRDHVIRNRDRLRNRLEEAAVATIAHKWGCSRERAREALREGTWTDDPHAAAYFTGEIEPVGIGRRVVLALSSEARYQRRARRAAEAIAELSAADADRVREEVLGA